MRSQLNLSRAAAVHTGNGEPEYDVPPPEPGDPVVTRRRILAQRPPTVDEEEIRQKRLRSEPVPELFPLTGEELSEDVFEILIDVFASPGSERCADSPVSEHCADSCVSEHCEDSRVSEAHVPDR